MKRLPPFHGIWADEDSVKGTRLADQLEPFLTATTVHLGDTFNRDRPHVLFPSALLFSIYTRLVAGTASGGDSPQKRGLASLEKERLCQGPAPADPEDVKRWEFKRRRLTLGFSQEAVARFAGVDQGSVSRYEGGRPRVSDKVAAQLRCALAAASFIRGADVGDLVALEAICTTEEEVK